MSTHISLMLAVDDAGKAAGWYKRALGANELWSLGSVVGLQIGEAPFFLHEPTSTGFASPVASGHTTVRVEVFMDDPDSFVRRLSKPAPTAPWTRYGTTKPRGASIGREGSAIPSATSGW